MLTAGTVSEELFFHLIKMSSIRSAKAIKALHDFFVHGHPRVDVCNRYMVSQGFLSLKIKDIRKVMLIACDFVKYCNSTHMNVGEKPTHSP